MDPAAGGELGPQRRRQRHRRRDDRHRPRDRDDHEVRSRGVDRDRRDAGDRPLLPRRSTATTRGSAGSFASSTSARMRSRGTSWSSWSADLEPATLDAVGYLRALRPENVRPLYIGPPEGFRETQGAWEVRAPRLGRLQPLEVDDERLGRRLRRYIRSIDREPGDFVTVVIPEVLTGRRVLAVHPPPDRVPVEDLAPVRGRRRGDRRPAAPRGGGGHRGRHGDGAAGRARAQRGHRPHLGRARRDRPSGRLREVAASGAHRGRVLHQRSRGGRGHRRGMARARYRRAPRTDGGAVP